MHFGLYVDHSAGTVTVGVGLDHWRPLRDTVRDIQQAVHGALAATVTESGHAPGVRDTAGHQQPHRPIASAPTRPRSVPSGPIWLVAGGVRTDGDPSPTVAAGTPCTGYPPNAGCGKVGNRKRLRLPVTV